MYYRRHLEDRLTGPVSRNKVRLLFGARQTGKTWLLRRLLAGQDTRAFDLQDIAVRRRFEGARPSLHLTCCPHAAIFSTCPG